MANSNLVALSFANADLLRELAIVFGSVERRPTVPILANVRLDASDFGHVTLTATDLELGMRCQFQANVEQAGAATIPAKRLLDLIRLLPEGDVSLKFSNNFWASIQAGRSKSRIAGMSVESFPDLPNVPGDATKLPLKALARGIQRVIFAISSEASRFTLNGALLEVGPDGLRLVATDGHRLAYAEVEGSGAPQKVVIPKKALVEISKLAASCALDATVEFATDDNHLFFTVGDRNLTARRVSGSFPDYQRVLPSKFKGTATVGVAELKDAIGRAKILADERTHCVKVTLADGSLTVSSGVSETGSTDESVAAEINGPNLEIGFNADYILDFLAVCGTEKAMLHYSDGTSAMQLTPVGEYGGIYRCVVMPMRV